MPREKQHKRLEKELLTIKAEMNERLVALTKHSDRAKALEVLTRSFVPGMSSEEADLLKQTLFAATMLPLYPVPFWDRKLNGIGVNLIIFALRSIVVRNGKSPSLSFTDAAQTKIDTLFARLLRAAWEIMPPHARSRTADAFVYRARTLRARRPRGGDMVLVAYVDRIGGLLIRWFDLQARQPPLSDPRLKRYQIDTFFPRTADQSKLV